MTKIYVKDLKKDNQISSYFAIKNKYPPKQYRNGFFFSLLLSDITGEIRVTYWGGPESETNGIFSSFEIQDVVQINNGKVDEYNGLISISINPPNGEIKKIAAYDIKDILPTTKHDIEEMMNNLKKTVNEITNPHIKKLVEMFTNDSEFMIKFSKSPAGKSYHHSYVGGLLEHVLNLIEVSYKVAERYLSIDRDLLIAACILHDIGKTVELEVGNTFDITTEGKLLGHLSIGYGMVAAKIQKLNDFPQDLRLKILHMILSHHGKLENGSPVEPKFVEAMAFSQIDNSDAQTNHVMQIKDKAISGPWVREFGEEYYTE